MVKSIEIGTGNELIVVFDTNNFKPEVSTSELEKLFNEAISEVLIKPVSTETEYTNVSISVTDTYAKFRKIYIYKINSNKLIKENIANYILNHYSNSYECQDIVRYINRMVSIKGPMFNISIDFDYNDHEKIMGGLYYPEITNIGDILTEDTIIPIINSYIYPIESKYDTFSMFLYFRKNINSEFEITEFKIPKISNYLLKKLYK